MSKYPPHCGHRGLVWSWEDQVRFGIEPRPPAPSGLLRCANRFEDTNPSPAAGVCFPRCGTSTAWLRLGSRLLKKSASPAWVNLMVWRPLASAPRQRGTLARSSLAAADRSPASRTVGAGGVRFSSVVGLSRFASSPMVCAAPRPHPPRLGAWLSRLRRAIFSAAR